MSFRYRMNIAGLQDASRTCADKYCESPATWRSWTGNRDGGTGVRYQCDQHVSLYSIEVEPRRPE